LAPGVEMSFRSRGNGMVRLRYPRRGADNSSLPGHTLRRGPEGHGKAARNGRRDAGSVNQAPTCRLMALAPGRPALCPGSVPHMLFVFDDQFCGGVADCEAASDAVGLEVGVLPLGGVAGQASASTTPASTSVLRSSTRPYPPSHRRYRSGPRCGMTSCWNGSRPHRRRISKRDFAIACTAAGLPFRAALSAGRRRLPRASTARTRVSLARMKPS
jgi:hypothetical protein